MTFATAEINGGPGVLITAGGQVLAAIAWLVAGGRVTAIQFITNPDKLRPDLGRPHAAAVTCTARTGQLGWRQAASARAGGAVAQAVHEQVKQPARPDRAGLAPRRRGTRRTGWPARRRARRPTAACRRRRPPGAASVIAVVSRSRLCAYGLPPDAMTARSASAMPRLVRHVVDVAVHPGAHGLRPAAWPASRSGTASHSLRQLVAVRGLDERLAGGEVPVQRADADAGVLGDRVERHVRPVLRERADGDVEQPVAVALRVRAQRPAAGGRHGLPPAKRPRAAGTAAGGGHGSSAIC